jgi:hypothetical protein
VVNSIIGGSRDASWVFTGAMLLAAVDTSVCTNRYPQPVWVQIVCILLRCQCLSVQSAELHDYHMAVLTLSRALAASAEDLLAEFGGSSAPAGNHFFNK